MTLERDSLLHNRYRIQEILGEGGMGAVYKARDENLGVTVAVKENLFSTDEYARQFRIEATILASLRHPNLTRVTDHFEEGDSQYLVMDFIEGEDLRDRMDRLGILDDNDVIIIGVAICDALTYLHSRVPTILHRDIKPGNVKIAPNGQVYLVDFGLAKIVHGTQMTITGARAMTPGYSPPEQYGTARTDSRSDIYSLGATLYSAITGALPEDGLARAMNQTELTAIRKHNPKVSKKLSQALEKSLGVQPDDRYQDAEGFRKGLLNSRSVTRRRSDDNDLTIEPAPSSGPRNSVPLDSIDTEDELTVPPPSVFSAVEPPSKSPPRARKSSGSSRRTKDEPLFETSPGPKRKKRRVGCGTIVSILLLLIIATFGGIYVFAPETGQEMLAFVLASPTETLVPTETEIPSTDVPTATQTLTPEPPTATPEPVDTVIPTRTATPTSIPPTTQVPTATEIVPATETPLPVPTELGGGASQVAFASNRSGSVQIWVMNSDGTEPRRITNIEDGACQPDWSPDGSQLVFISPCEGEQEKYTGAGLFIINVDGTGLTPLASSLSGDYDPDWSPDGTKILFTSLRNGTPQIFTLTLADESVTLLAEEGLENIYADWSSDGSEIVFVTNRDGPYQVWFMEGNGTEQARFSRSGSLKDTAPVWSPDSRWLIFTQRALPTGIPRLILVVVSGDGLSETTLTNPSIPSRAASYSSDGEWIVFESWPDGQNHDIYRMNLSTREITRLTEDSAFDFDSVWRPGTP